MNGRSRSFDHAKSGTDAIIVKFSQLPSYLERLSERRLLRSHLRSKAAEAAN